MAERPDLCLNAQAQGRMLEQIAALDAVNPQVAARLLGAFESWRNLAQPLRSRSREALASLEGRLDSPDGRDLLQRLLG